MAITDTVIDMLRSWYNGLSAIKTDGSAVTQPVSMSSLPPGISTAALQTSGNVSLSSIDSKLTTALSLLTSIDSKVTQLTYSFRQITGNATTVIKSGSGVLRGIILGNSSTLGTVIIYDNNAGSGTVICSLQLGSPVDGVGGIKGTPIPNFLGPTQVAFSTGLTVVTAGSTSNSISVIYS